MPRYMLDTNMCIYLMKHQPEAVARRFAQCFVGDVVMSSITFAELQYGVAVSADPVREHENLASLIEDMGPNLDLRGAKKALGGKLRSVARRTPSQRSCGQIHG